MQQVSIKQAFWDYNFTEQQLLQKLSKGTKEEKAWSYILSLWEKYDMNYS